MASKIFGRESNPAESIRMKVRRGLANARENIKGADRAFTRSVRTNADPAINSGVAMARHQAANAMDYGIRGAAAGTGNLLSLGARALPSRVSARAREGIASLANGYNDVIDDAVRVVRPKADNEYDRALAALKQNAGNIGRFGWGAVDAIGRNAPAAATQLAYGQMLTNPIGNTLARGSGTIARALKASRHVPGNIKDKYQALHNSILNPALRGYVTNLRLDGMVKKMPVLGKAIRFGANRIGDVGRIAVNLSNMFQRPDDAVLKPGSLLSRARQLGSNAALLSPFGARYWMYNKLTPDASNQTSRLIGKELVAPMTTSTAGNPGFQQHLKNVAEQLPNTPPGAWQRLATRWKGHPVASAAMDTGINWAVNMGNPLLPSLPGNASVKQQPIMKEVFRDLNTRAIPRALSSRLNMPPGMAEQIALRAGESPRYARLHELFGKR